MQLRSISKLCISFLLASFCSLTLAADPMLNGMAIHVDLGKEQFIGALYSTPLSDNPDKLLANTQSMRMELKIVAPEGVTTRRFSRWWIEGMAINNSASLLTDQADNMVKFDGLFKGRFAPNDTIAFISEPGKGVNITINDVLLGNIASDKFFSMLLRTWIGKVPLSSDYKDGILKNGNISAELKSRFDKMKPSKERTTEVAGWSKIKSAADLAAEKEKEKEAKEAAAKSSSSSSVDNAKQLAAQKAEQAKAEAAKLAAQKATTSTVAATSDDEDEKPALTAQTLLARQFYVSDQLKKVYANVRYPKKALEKGQTGSVRLTIVINRQGSLVSASIAQASEFEILNEAALEAVNKTTFSPMPDTITGTTFEFNAPLRFTLQQR
ncbi:MAG TPA: TonB family protein [Cellvibrio sp.]|nr:TonB family protein [Cellvibrio sp.]